MKAKKLKWPFLAERILLITKIFSAILATLAVAFSAASFFVPGLIILAGAVATTVTAIFLKKPTISEKKNCHNGYLEIVNLLSKNHILSAQHKINEIHIKLLSREFCLNREESILLFQTYVFKVIEVYALQGDTMAAEKSLTAYMKQFQAGGVTAASIESSRKVISEKWQSVFLNNVIYS